MKKFKLHIAVALWVFAPLAFATAINPDLIVDNVADTAIDFVLAAGPFIAGIAFIMGVFAAAAQGTITPLLPAFALTIAIVAMPKVLNTVLKGSPKPAEIAVEEPQSDSGQEVTASTEPQIKSEEQKLASAKLPTCIASLKPGDTFYSPTLNRKVELTEITDYFFIGVNEFGEQEVIPKGDMKCDSNG